MEDMIFHLEKEAWKLEHMVSVHINKKSKYLNLTHNISNPINIAHDSDINVD